MEMIYFLTSSIILLSICLYIANNFGALAEFINSGQEFSKQEKIGLSFLKTKKSKSLFLILSLVSIIASYFVFDLWQAQVIYSICSVLLISGFFMDISVKLLPDVFTISLLWIGLLAAALGFSSIGAASAIIASIVLYIAFMFIDTVGEAIAKREVIGGGDIKIMAAFGALFGIMQSIILLIIACAIMLVFVGGLKLSKKHHDKELPFGVGLTIAAMINIFCPALIMGILDYLMI